MLGRLITKYTRLLAVGDYGMLDYGPVEGDGEDAGEEALGEARESWRGDLGKCMHLSFSTFELI